jgi:hypothetical protein
MGGPLKLCARDEEDVSVISACLQDALVSFADVSFLPVRKRFVLVANRFKWENCPDFPVERPAEAAGKPCTSYERVNCALCFDEVTGVRLTGLPSSEELKLLELLAITVERGDPEVGGKEAESVVLHFAGGGSIHLDIGGILCHLEDVGRPWRTDKRPCHPLDPEE